MSEWDALHEQLKGTLQKEVNIMRELLANLHQEELSRVFRDEGSLNQVLQQRSQIVDRLSSLRISRIKTTEMIEQIVATKEEHPSVDQILPPQEEMSTEILSLRDQLMALTEQLNRQQSYNQYIIEHPEQLRSHQQQLEAARPKKKAIVATYQIKR